MEPQTTPEVVPIESIKPASRLPMILLVLGLLVVVGLGGFVAGLRLSSPAPAPIVTITPTPDSTSTLETYTNSDLGFSIKYNSTFSPVETFGDGQQLALIVFGSTDDNGFNVEVSTGDNIGYYKNRIIGHMADQIDKEEPILVDGVGATKFTFSQVTPSKEVDVSMVVVNKNDRDYIITALSTEINQILSTFKFLPLSNSPTETPETSLPKTTVPYVNQTGWQTYSDSIAKFSIQYNNIPTGQFKNLFKMGNSEMGKSMNLLSCNTPSSGPTAGNEVCLSGINVTVHNNYNGGSRREWFSTNYPSSTNCRYEYGDITIAGKNALGVVSDYCSSFTESYILIPNGSQMLMVHFIDDYRNADWAMNILSTFKYL